jgi:hypothetical protein
MRPILRRRILPLLSAALTLLGCEHPIAVVTPHVEASDLLVRDTLGVLQWRTMDNQRWNVSALQLQVGDSVPVMIRLTDFQGTEFDLRSRGPEYSVRLEVERGASVGWEPLTRFGWIRAFAPDSTRFRLQVWHTDHADFITPWLTVVVRPRTGP